MPHLSGDTISQLLQTISHNINIINVSPSVSPLPFDRFFLLIAVRNSVDICKTKKLQMQKEQQHSQSTKHRK